MAQWVAEFRGMLSKLTVLAQALLEGLELPPRTD